MTDILKDEFLKEITRIDDTNRLHRAEIDKNGVERNKLVRALWDMTGGFQEGDAVVDKNGKRGVVADVSVYMVGSSLGHHSTVRKLTKNGAPSMRALRMWSWEEWRKES